MCDIGPAEIRKRRMSGSVGLAASVVFLILAFVLRLGGPMPR
ncbi:hypothetical protein [Microbacterium sp. SS28]|nr:hypothetical protein [Microbacterium sp. SS28]